MDRAYRPVPAEPFDDRPAVVIDGAYGTPPLRSIDHLRDVTPRDRLPEPSDDDDDYPGGYLGVEP